ncbi:hypothetical protein J6590_005171 [Homalodisca vitripennis]|nr:hypothetical protein J6590_005171 [Homalodisca vitripennis]
MGRLVRITLEVELTGFLRTPDEISPFMPIIRTVSLSYLPRPAKIYFESTYDINEFMLLITSRSPHTGYAQLETIFCFCVYVVICFSMRK